MQTLKMTNLGNANFYLGVEILQDYDGTYFHQRGYIERLLNRFGMKNCTILSTSMNPKIKLSKETHTQPGDIKIYQSLIGGLLHATISRWDIQYAIGCVSRYLTNLQMEHIIYDSCKKYPTLSQRVFQLWIILSKTKPRNSDNIYRCRLDSRRSTSGILYKFGETPVAWSSKLQPTVALSLTKAKYRAVLEVACNISYLQ